MAGLPHLDVSSLSFAYKRGHEVLRDVGLEAHSGEVIALVGANGAGKTTLLRLLLGLVKPDRGSISPAGAKLSCAFQEERLVPGLSAVGNVLLACPCTRAQAESAFGALGFEAHTMHQPVCELSGGQQRRVSLARAMLADSAAVLLDEPFKGLDDEAKAAAAAFVREIAAGRAVVCVTHDAADAGLLAARTVTLSAASGGEGPMAR